MEPAATGHAYGQRDLVPSDATGITPSGRANGAPSTPRTLSGPTVRQSATEDTCYTGWLEVDGDYGTTDVYIGRYLAGSLTVLATTRINAVVEGLAANHDHRRRGDPIRGNANSPEIVPGTQSEDGIRAANDHTTLLTVTDTVITPEMGPYIGGRIWGGASNIIHELAGGALSAVKVADATYPSDTTWEVLIPVSEVVGGATFEAVASTGETAEISLTIYESNTTDSTHGTDSNDVAGSNNIDVSVSDSAASSDLTAASVTTTVATSVTATFLLAASIAFVVIYDTATTDTASASDSTAVAMSVRTTDSTTSIDSVGIAIDVPGTTTNTTDSTEATDETTVLELWRALVADSSPSTDAVTVALDVVHQDATTATDSASVPVWTSATEDSTTSSDTNSLVAIATTIPTNTTDGTGSTDATVADQTARSTDLSISQDIGSAWQSGPETVASSADDLSTSTDLALVKIRGIADEVKVTVEWADVSTVASVQFVSSVALVYVYVPSKKEVRSWHT